MFLVQNIMFGFYVSIKSPSGRKLGGLAGSRTNVRLVSALHFSLFRECKRKDGECIVKGEEVDV